MIHTIYVADYKEDDDDVELAYCLNVMLLDILKSRLSIKGELTQLFL